MHIKRTDIWLLVLLGLFALAIFDIDRTNGKAITDFFMRAGTGFVEDSHYGMSTVGGLKATRTGTFSFDRKAAEVLKLDNPMGSISVKGVKSESVKVRYTIKVYGEDAAEARRFIKRIKLAERFAGDKAVITRNLGNYFESIKGVAIDYIIEMPIAMKFDGANKYGRLSISGIPKGATLANRYGDSEVSRMGPTKFEAAYGNVSIDRIDGDLRFDGRYGKGIIFGVSGEVGLDVRYMPVICKDIQGDLDAETRYGNLEIRDAARNANIEGRYSSITFDAGDSKDGYKIAAKADMGTVSTVGFGDKADHDDRSYKTVIGQGGYDVHIDADYGNITIER